MSIGFGYAIKAMGAIDMATVSDSVKAAKVNWLCRHGMLLTQMQSSLIDPVFEGFATKYGLECVKVTVTEAK